MKHFVEQVYLLPDGGTFREKQSLAGSLDYDPLHDEIDEGGDDELGVAHRLTRGYGLLAMGEIHLLRI